MDFVLLESAPWFSPKITGLLENAAAHQGSVVVRSKMIASLKTKQ
jgi:hypothetical protein